MSQDVLHFQCMACQAPLTVPVHLAGVTGPCPKCGATVTSPPAPPALAPAPELLAVPPMPSMPPQPPQFPPQMVPREQQPVATIPQPQACPAPEPQQPAAGGWGGPMTMQPQQPVAHLPPAQPGYAVPEAPPPSPATTTLPPRRQPGLAPVGNSLMNQQGGLGGFGPAPGGMSNPSAAPQWTLPGATDPPPMPNREIEDPMTTILRGTTGTGAASELETDPRRLTAFDPTPALVQAPAPVSAAVPMSRQVMDVRLGGRKRGSGKWIATLAALLLVGALGAAGWIFKKPIMELVQGYFPSKSADEASATTTSPDATKETVKEPVTKPFDPLAKPSEGLTIQKPAPIILQNATPGTSKPATGDLASSIPGATPPLPAPPVTEIKPAGTPETIRLPEVPTVPKATIVEDGPEGASPPKAQHVPGTALGKKGGETKTGTLVEVTPGAPPPAAIAPVPGGAQSATITTEAAKHTVVQASPESQKAAEALQAFFAAKNLAERMPLTLGSENMKSLMERYYAKKDSGAIEVDEIKLLRYDPAPDTGGGPHCVFTAASKLWEYPIPVMLQEEGGSFKVDWLSFVEFRDNLLFEFLSGYQEMPARFHVGIRRTHYFENDVPNLGEQDCFEIQPPLPTYVGYVFVPKNTPLAADLGSRISWETLTAYVIVELRWRRLGDMKWVELTAVPQLNWYSIPRADQAGASPATKAPTEKKSSGGKDIKKPK